MSLLVFRRGVFHTQLRQFTTLLVCNRSETRKVIDSWEKIACPNLSSRNSTACRLFASERKSGNISSEALPPLIEFSGGDSSILLSSWYTFFKYGINFRKYDFTFMEFSQGSTIAAHIVSHALAMQDYKALNGLVCNDTIEVLRHSVDCLSPVQRRKIDLTNACCDTFVRNLTIEKSNDGEESRFVGEIYIIYKHLPISENEHHACNYIFERVIKDYNTPWIVTWLNHYRIADYVAYIKGLH